jgi:Tol biopolymer transport system component
MKNRLLLLVFVSEFALALLGSPSLARAEQTLDVDAAHPGRLILHVCEIDGTPIRPLIANEVLRHEFDRQGTPDVSADGKWVAFDAWSTAPEFANRGPRCLVCNLNGKNASAPVDGYMPSFSPDAKKIVVSRTPPFGEKEGAKGQSIWIIDLETKEKQMIADRGAWGGRWSHDGASILFQGGVDEQGEKLPSSCLRLYDVASKKFRMLLDPIETPFSELVHHFDWSPGDSRKIAFGGSLRNASGTASAIMNVDEGVSSLLLLTPPADGTRVIDGFSFDWHPDGNSIMVTGVLGNRLFPVSLSTTEQPSQVTYPGFPASVMVRDPVYTPDGEHIIASLGSLNAR